MHPTHRRELPSEYGSEVVYITRTLGASPITASNTTRIRMPALPKKAIFRAITATNTVAGVSASGTIIAKANKVTGTNTRTDLSEALDLEAVTALKSATAKFKRAVASSSLIVNPGDGIEVSVVSDAAIGTQPTDLSFTLEFFILN